MTLLTNKGFQIFIVALAGIAAFTVLLALGNISSEVAVPGLSSIVFGFLGLNVTPSASADSTK